MTEQTTTVSVVVPIYNVERFLPQCLDSIVSQLHKDLDIILVNDGSTDSSARIADDYAARDGRIRVIHKKNEGVSTARNAGIEAAKGEYVCFVDGDDYVMPDYVEYMLGMAVKNNASVALTTRMYSTFNTTVLTNVNRGGVNARDSICKVVTGEEAAASILYYDIPIGCYSKLFKRSFIEKHGLRFLPDVFVGEGFNFNATAFQYADRVAVSDKKIYCYRRDNPASCMTAFSLRKCQMALQAIDIIRYNLILKSEKLYRACDFADWHTHTDMYNWMVLAKVKQTYPKEYARCRSVAWRFAPKALLSPINRKERFRALVQMIHPRLLAALLEYRRWRAKVKA